MYSYTEAIKDDIRDYIENEGIEVTTDNREEIEEKLYEDLWTTDSATGNASGSYTFSRRMAQEYVMDNIGLLEEAANEFGIGNDTIGRKLLEEDWEYFDVTIRCSLLGGCLSEVLDELEHEPEEQDDTEYNWETHTAAELQ